MLHLEYLFKYLIIICCFISKVTNSYQSFLLNFFKRKDII